MNFKGGDSISGQGISWGSSTEEEVRFDAPDTLGFTIINTLSKQLGADMDVDTSSKGTRVMLEFKRKETKGSTSNLRKDF